MFPTKVVEKIKTHILCPITFPENPAIYEITWKNIVEQDRFTYLLHGAESFLRS